MSESRRRGGDDGQYRRRKAIGVEEFATGKKKGVTRAIHAYNERKEKKVVEKSKLLRQYQKAMKKEGYEPGRGASRKRYARSDNDDDNVDQEKNDPQERRRKKLKKSDPLAKSRERAEEMKQEKQRAHQEKLDKQKQKEAQLQKRKIRAKNMSKRTRKGQPLMKNQITSILEKLEQQF